MRVIHTVIRSGKQLKKRFWPQKRCIERLAVFFLSLAMMAGHFPALAAEAAPGAGDKPLSSVVTFDCIELYHDNGSIPPNTPITDGDLLEANAPVLVYYTYNISEMQCRDIEADVPYYLDTSPHLKLPDFGYLDLQMTVDGVEEKFGEIHANGVDAWVVFTDRGDGKPKLLDYGGELYDAQLYLGCTRVASVPSGQIPIESGNRYGIELEGEERLRFGYKEKEPVAAEAELGKSGSRQDKTITWEISYTPWQNPGADAGLDLDTPFELRDTIDNSLHSYVDGSIEIDGMSATPVLREDLTGDPEEYVIKEVAEDGSITALAFGGRKFKAGQATEEAPAQPVKITYQTSIKDEILLPASSGGSKKIQNTVDLFNCDTDKKVKSVTTSVDVPKPTWIEKTGVTARVPGSGATTDWTVRFYLNGFTFTNDNELALYDLLPDSSALVGTSVEVDGVSVTPAVTGKNFTISPIVPAAGSQSVIITYQTKISEDVYSNGTDLGNNIAKFRFLYDGEEYWTSTVEPHVPNGEPGGGSGTSTLLKVNGGYNAASREIQWTATINPHKAYLQSGTFTDDLRAAGPTACALPGHGHGLELKGDVNDISIAVDGQPPTAADRDKIVLSYDEDSQILTVKAGDIGMKKIELTYITKVCDPCVFANNTTTVNFKNIISTTNMKIGTDPMAPDRSTFADSTAKVRAAVLEKKAPVYDYASHIMKWAVEVNAAGLSMEDVILTDTLPDGLEYIPGSFTTSPEITGAQANAVGQDLTIDLGTFTGTTTVSFNTTVNPETLGFAGDKTEIEVDNAIHMNGKADSVEFAQVSHTAKQKFSNHGLVKESSVDNDAELIEYKVLLNPLGLELPEQPVLVDTLDKRLQLDPDTLRFYKVALSGEMDHRGQKPSYTQDSVEEKLEITDCDLETNTFKVKLPIAAGSRDAYVLAYTADIIQRQAGGYGNKARFEGGDVQLGGEENNNASVSGGGGGGGGGVAARKATIAISKTDKETAAPLSGVSFILYTWNDADDERGLPFAQGTTDSQGELSFRVKPGASYELVESDSLPGYSSAFGWMALPGDVTETADGIRITAGAAQSELALDLTNEANTTEIAFSLVNESGIPMAGTEVELFTSDPTHALDPTPDTTTTVGLDGMLRFFGIRCGRTYYIRPKGGDVLIITVPLDIDGEAKVRLPDGTEATLTEDYRLTSTMPLAQQWELNVQKVVGGSTAPLPGATIGLYADQRCQILIKTGVSDQNGAIIFGGLMEDQKYWLKEMSAPAGYQLSSVIYESNKASANVTIENEPEALPENPEIPGDPDTPEGPDTPGDPDTPESPDVPEAPDTPGDPAIPGNPNAPGDPERPGSPEIPGNPSMPGTPNVSESPDVPDDPSTRNIQIGEDRSNAAGGSRAPQTGDSASWYSVIRFLTGILLAALAFYRYAERKK